MGNTPSKFTCHEPDLERRQLPGGAESNCYSPFDCKGAECNPASCALPSFAMNSVWQGPEKKEESQPWTISGKVELELFLGFARTHHLQRATHNLPSDARTYSLPLSERFARTTASLSVQDSKPREQAHGARTRHGRLRNGRHLHPRPLRHYRTSPQGPRLLQTVRWPLHEQPDIKLRRLIPHSAMKEGTTSTPRR